MPEPIAICAIACRLPEAATPQSLWRNLMHGRRAFRALPGARLPLVRYGEAHVGAVDAITPIAAGLLTNWQFDPARFDLPERTVRHADLSHWLALDVAADAIAALGGRDRLCGERVGVIVAGNPSGEFTGTAELRARQPFLDGLLQAALADSGLEEDVAEKVRRRFAAALKARLPAPSAESRAGGLAGAMAGRIAARFDLTGGAHVVDAAGASSLLALADAAERLAAGALDAALVAAVDLRLDPVELIGLSRSGVLSASRMRVFDARADGFWPGEGAAACILMREADARGSALPVLAVLRGIGRASGIGPDSAEGCGPIQQLAADRAHAMAGVAPQDVLYIEAHGLGTKAGDAGEIRALSEIYGDRPTPLPIGSIKANIGHARAAAGLAGLVKLVQSFRAGALPPHVSCDVPNPVFAECDRRVQPLSQALPLAEERPVITALAGTGAGGTHVHVLLEAAGPARSAALREAPRQLISTDQGTELFVFAGEDPADLQDQLARIAPVATSLSLAQCGDLAAELARRARFGASRLALVADGGERLAAGLAEALAWLERGAPDDAVPKGLHAMLKPHYPRIGLMFSGLSAPVRAPSLAWLRRFPGLGSLARAVPPSFSPQAADPASAQPAVAYANLAGLQVLGDLGITGDFAIGHGLGELCALVFAGAVDPAEGLALATRRGQILKTFGEPGGGMAVLSAPRPACDPLIAATGAVIAGLDGPAETVISGPVEALDKVRGRASAAGIGWRRLTVPLAFHSPAMAAAQAQLQMTLERSRIAELRRPVISTLTGQPFEPVDVASATRDLLQRQLVSPVLFDAALDRLDREDTLLIECGPGGDLARLARARGFAAHAMDSQNPDFTPLIEALAALYVAGAEFDLDALFRDRGTYPFDREIAVPTLLSSPCGEAAPVRSRTAAGAGADAPRLQGQGPDAGPQMQPSAKSAGQAVAAQDTTPAAGGRNAGGMPQRLGPADGEGEPPAVNDEIVAGRQRGHVNGISRPLPTRDLAMKAAGSAAGKADSPVVPMLNGRGAVERELPAPHRAVAAAAEVAERSPAAPPAAPRPTGRPPLPRAPQPASHPPTRHAPGQARPTMPQRLPGPRIELRPSSLLGGGRADSLNGHAPPGAAGQSSDARNGRGEEQSDTFEQLTPGNAPLPSASLSRQAEQAAEQDRPPVQANGNNRSEPQRGTIPEAAPEDIKGPEPAEPLRAAAESFEETATGPDRMAGAAPPAPSLVEREVAASLLKAIGSDSMETDTSAAIPAEGRVPDVPALDTALPPANTISAPDAGLVEPEREPLAAAAAQVTAHPVRFEAARRLAGRMEATLSLRRPAPVLPREAASPQAPPPALSAEPATGRSVAGAAPDNAVADAPGEGVHRQAAADLSPPASSEDQTPSDPGAGEATRDAAPTPVDDPPVAEVASVAVAAAKVQHVDPLPDADALPPFLLSAKPSPDTPVVGPDVAVEPAAQADPAVILDTVLALLAREAHLPVERLHPDMPFDSGLGLSRIAIARLVEQSAAALGLGTGVEEIFDTNVPEDMSARQVADHLQRIAARGTTADSARRMTGLKPWFAPYAMQWRRVERLPQPPAVPPEPSHRLVLEPPFGQPEAELLLKSLRDLARGEPVRLEILHRGAPVSGLLRSVYREGSFPAVTLIDLGAADLEDVRIARLCRLTASRAFAEFRLETDGQVASPVFAPAPVTRAAVPQAGRDDIVLAVNCLTGFAADCALALGEGSGGLLLVGDEPEDPDGVETMLAAARRRGISARFAACDVTDPHALQALSNHPDLAGSAPSVLLYGAEDAAPAPIGQLSDEAIRAALQMRCDGLVNSLVAFGPGLSRLVALGSLYGRIGLEGSGHLALANAMQTLAVERFQRIQPDCKALTIEWPAMAADQMAAPGQVQPSGDVDRLSREEARGLFCALIARGAVGTVSVTGRFGQRLDLDLGAPEREPLIFSERLILHYPGSEAVLEAELHVKSDPYLEDHRLLGQSLFPSVMGIEAMAEAAGLVSPATDWRLTDLEFTRPVAVPEAGHGIRVAAQRSGGGDVVEAGLFSREDGFLRPCMTARFRPASGRAGETALAEVGASPRPAVHPPLMADLAPLYGPLFFEGPRFARLGVLNDLTSRRVDVTVSRATGGGWFGDAAPQALVLGDPAVSHCALHMVQLAVPHRRLLPVGIAEIDVLGDQSTTCRMIATENWTRGDRYSFDITAYDAEDRPTLVLTGACFRAVAALNADAVVAAAPALAEVLLERLSRQELDDGLRLALVRDAGLDPDQRRAAAMDRLELREQALGRKAQAPGRAAQGSVGVSHTRGSTLAILSDTPVGCDLVDLTDTLPQGFDAEGFSENEVRMRLARAIGAAHGTEAEGSDPETSRHGDGPDIEIARKVMASIGLAAAIGVGARQEGRGISAGA